MHICLRSEEGPRTGTEVTDGSATLWILGTELNWNSLQEHQLLLIEPSYWSWCSFFDSPIGYAAQELSAAGVSSPSHLLWHEGYRFCVLLCRSNLQNWNNGLILPLVGEEDFCCKILSCDYGGSHLTVPARGRLKEKFRVVHASLGYVRHCLKLIFWTTQNNLKI